MTLLSYRPGPPHHILVILAVFTSEIFVLLRNSYARQNTKFISSVVAKQLSDFSLYRSEIPPDKKTWMALLVLGKIPVHIVVVVLAVAGALRELSHVVVHLLTRQLGVRSWKNNEETI